MYNHINNKKMKKIIISIIAISSLFAACTKEVQNVSTVVTVVYPVITLKGAQVVSTGIGTGTYSDPGATSYDALTGTTKNLSPISNNVDLTTPGFYSVQYSDTNGDGFYSGAIRLILVTGVSPTVDLSGTYARQSNGQTVTVTKQGTGLYTTSNVGGVASSNAAYLTFLFPIYFGQISDTTIAIPVQPCPLGGTIYCDGGSASAPYGALSLTPPITYSYVVEDASSFGTAVRVFVHQ
jgi:hypothetical protein